MTLVIACATVIEEMLPLLPPEVGHRVLDFGLHTDPAKLRLALSRPSTRWTPAVDTIILGYGLCSQGVVGLKAAHSRLVVPRVDDCISIFLGSGAAYREQARSEPGTYYLTKGWIEVGESPFSEHEKTVRRYGPEKAERIYRDHAEELHEAGSHQYRALRPGALPGVCPPHRRAVLVALRGD